MFSCVVSRESTVRLMESGAQSCAPAWTPLHGGVDVVRALLGLGLGLVRVRHTTYAVKMRYHDGADAG